MAEPMRVLPSSDGDTKRCEGCGIHAAGYQAWDEDFGTLDLCPHCYGEPHDDEPCRWLPDTDPERSDKEQT